MVLFFYQHVSLVNGGIAELMTWSKFCESEHFNKTQENCRIDFALAHSWSNINVYSRLIFDRLQIRIEKDRRHNESHLSSQYTAAAYDITSLSILKFLWDTVQFIICKLWIFLIANVTFNVYNKIGYLTGKVIKIVRIFAIELPLLVVLKNL